MELIKVFYENSGLCIRLRDTPKDKAQEILKHALTEESECCRVISTIGVVTFSNKGMIGYSLYDDIDDEMEEQEKIDLELARIELEIARMSLADMKRERELTRGDQDADAEEGEDWRGN